MEWLIANKEWIFSGIGIAIPVAVVGWLFASRNNKQKQSGGDNSTNIQIGGNLTIDERKHDE